MISALTPDKADNSVMKNFFSYIIVGMLCLSLPSESWSAKRRGNPFYVSAAGALVVPQSSDLGSSDPAVDTTIQNSNLQLDFSTGMGANAAVGLFFKRRFRVEFEYAYKSVDIDEITGNIAGGPSVSVPVMGDISINTFMANAVFDFRNSSRFSPYLGAGIGAGHIDFENPSFTTLGVNVNASSDSDLVFAFQLFGGISYWVNPQIVGFAGYKYMSTSDPTIQTITSTIDTHNFELGIRYYFSRP